MKKRILSLVLVMVFTFTMTAFASDGSDELQKYNVPVHLEKYGSTELSDFDDAFRNTAYVETEAGDTTYTLYFSDMPLDNKTVRVSQVVFNNDEVSIDAVRTASKLGENNEITTNMGGSASMPIISDFVIKRAADKEDKMELLLQLDRVKGNKLESMDDQKVTLVFDWSKAEKIIDRISIFTDVKKDDWFKDAVNYAVEAGMFKGKTATEFAPNENITRGQLVTVLGRIANVNVNEFKGSKFSDVPANAYYAPYINWAEENKLLHSESLDEIAPNGALQRQEMAYILNGFLKLQGMKLKSTRPINFGDEDEIDDYAVEAVHELATAKIVNGSEDGDFNPTDNFTRAQFAQVLYNIYGKKAD